MSYYPTLVEDLTRAKQILEKGTYDPEDRFRVAADTLSHVEGAQVGAGAIYGADTYAAYKLLESFVQEIEKHLGLFSDYYEMPCTSFAQIHAIWNSLLTCHAAEILQERRRAEIAEGFAAVAAEGRDTYRKDLNQLRHEIGVQIAEATTLREKVEWEATKNTAAERAIRQNLVVIEALRKALIEIAEGWTLETLAMQSIAKTALKAGE